MITEDDDPFGADEPLQMVRAPQGQIHVPPGFHFPNLKPHIARMHGMWYCIWPLWLSGTITDKEKDAYGRYMRWLNGVDLHGQRITPTEVPEHPSLQ
jgi:hypothetical protein